MFASDASFPISVGSEPENRFPLLITLPGIHTHVSKRSKHTSIHFQPVIHSQRIKDRQLPNLTRDCSRKWVIRKSSVDWLQPSTNYFVGLYLRTRYELTNAHRQTHIDTRFVNLNNCVGNVPLIELRSKVLNVVRHVTRARATATATATHTHIYIYISQNTKRQRHIKGKYQVSNSQSSQRCQLSNLRWQCSIKLACIQNSATQTQAHIKRAQT